MENSLFPKWPRLQLRCWMWELEWSWLLGCLQHCARVWLEKNSHDGASMMLRSGCGPSVLSPGGCDTVQVSRLSNPSARGEKGARLAPCFTSAPSERKPHSSKHFG
ncbi:rCG44385 [Rattus norvegicus]|uniref:RCG44385 n=1 Tax=Rattus norvegicus TaxID=10116 RepID=A6I5S0_RAT|nr:rCG44385 [Rattus norvegicus]